MKRKCFVISKRIFRYWNISNASIPAEVWLSHMNSDVSSWMPGKDEHNRETNDRQAGPVSEPSSASPEAHLGVTFKERERAVSA